jgi:hypothetical protein
MSASSLPNEQSGTDNRSQQQFDVGASAAEALMPAGTQAADG